MPIPDNINNYYDFEELFFEKNSDVNIIISNFFMKYKDTINSDTEYITYKIKQQINEDRKMLMYIHEISENGQDRFNRRGKISYIKHYVIPEKNNGKEYYVYCINSFI